MTEQKRAKRRKQYSILDFFEETMSEFPSDAERKEIMKNLNILIEYLQNLCDRVESLPKEDQQEKVVSAIATIRNFLVSSREKPFLAAALGQTSKKAMKSRKARKEVSPIFGQKVFDEIKTLSTERIQEKLLDYKRTSMDELRSLASYLEIKNPERIKRQELVDKIVKIGFANIRGYEILRAEED